MTTLATALLRGPEGARRAGDLRHSRRLRPAVLQGHRGLEDPAALHAQPRAGGGLRGRCGRPLSRRARRRGRHLRRRRVQRGQCDRRRLCGTLAGGGDRRRAGRARAGGPLPAASPGAQPRHPARRLSRDHLRPGGARRSGARPRGDRAGAAQRARAVAAGLHRGAARHGRRPHGGGAGAAAPAGRSRRARRMRRRDPGEARAGARPGDDRRRGDPPLRRRARDRGARARARAAGRHHLHGTRPSGGRRRRRWPAPISAPPATRRSPGWSRTPTPCCCSA